MSCLKVGSGWVAVPPPTPGLSAGGGVGGDGDQYLLPPQGSVQGVVVAQVSYILEEMALPPHSIVTHAECVEVGGGGGGRWLGNLHNKNHGNKCFSDNGHLAEV